MSDNVLELIPAAFTGCSHDETCRNMAVMEALRVQAVEATIREAALVNVLAASEALVTLLFRGSEAIREDAGKTRRTANVANEIARATIHAQPEAKP